jgi:hypothetical protein
MTIPVPGLQEIIIGLDHHHLSPSNAMVKNRLRSGGREASFPRRNLDY